MVGTKQAGIPVGHSPPTHRGIVAESLIHYPNASLVASVCSFLSSSSSLGRRRPVLEWSFCRVAASAASALGDGDSGISPDSSAPSIEELSSLGEGSDATSVDFFASFEVPATTREVEDLLIQFKSIEGPEEVGGSAGRSPPALVNRSNSAWQRLSGREGGGDGIESCLSFRRSRRKQLG